MSVDKVSGPRGPSAASKKKKTGGASSADGPSFASLVDSADGVAATDAVETVERREGGKKGGYVPQEATERGAWMLDKLEQLYASILAGDPAVAMADLRQALATEALDYDKLPDHLKRLVDEIDVRSAVEIAKLEVGKKRTS